MKEPALKWAICPQCHRRLLLGPGVFLPNHKEELGSSVICYMSGTYALNVVQEPANS